MRILHISNPVSIPVKGYGGTERVIYSLAKMQAENEHEVTIIAGKPSIIPHVKDASFEKGSHYTERKFVIKRLLTAYALRAMLESRKDTFDIIHNHISEEGIPSSVFSKIPVITTLHCPLTLRKFWPFITTSVSSLLPRKTKLVTISKRAYNAYKPFFGKDLISFIHNGINIEHIPFYPKPKKDYELQLCTIGKIVPEKNLHVAIKVADLLNEKGYDIKLFLMGKLDFPLSNYAKRLIAMVRERKHVSLLPNVSTEKLYNILGSCDAFITVSREIGFLIAQLEALATGTPVIGLFDSPAEEVVKHGLNGYLCRSLEDLAEKSLLARELDRRKCRLIVETNFSEKAMYEKYLNLYYLLQDLV